MPKIRNAGTATMKFNEGVIVSGSASQPDGTYSDYALIVTGSVLFDTRDGSTGNSGGLSIVKDEGDPVFIRFINDDDPTSWYAYMAMDSAENFYIAPGRSQDFYFITRENSGSDYFFPFRIFDNGKIKFHQAAQSSSDNQVELSADVVFSVSGSNDRQNSALFGGDVVISGSLYAKQKHFTTHKYSLLSSNSATLVRFNAGGSDLTTSGQVNNKFVAPASGKLKSVTIRSTDTPGSTEIAFMKITDGTETFGDPGSPAAAVTVDIATDDTAYQAIFPDNAAFSLGNVLGIRINPTNNHGNVDLTCVWEFDWVS